MKGVSGLITHVNLQLMKTEYGWLSRVDKDRHIEYQILVLCAVVKCKNNNQINVLCVRVYRLKVYNVSVKIKKGVKRKIYKKNTICVLYRIFIV